MRNVERIITLAVVLCALCVGQLHSQELKCDVRVMATKISNVDNSVFTSLKDAVYDFMNNRRWTEINFKDEERIECTITITVNEAVSDGNYVGDFTVAFNRPVFQSSYLAPMLTHIDKGIQFEYVPSTTLDYSDNTYTSNLTSVLAFYAYMIIGMDFDTFSPNGGETFFRSAESVVSAASSSGMSGWGSIGETKSRYWMVENLTNSRYAKLHEFLYKYHRLGLDVMHKDTKNGRAEIFAALEALQEVCRERPNLFMAQLIIEAKRNEIMNIFEGAEKNERTKAMNIMRGIDPSKATEYDEVIAGRRK